MEESSLPKNVYSLGKAVSSLSSLYFFLDYSHVNRAREQTTFCSSLIEAIEGCLGKDFVALL